MGATGATPVSGTRGHPSDQAVETATDSHHREITPGRDEMSICPHEDCDFKPDTEFKYDKGMFDPEGHGEFKCPECGQMVYWASSAVIVTEFETDPWLL